MKTEKSNYKFSILFFIWVVFYTAALWRWRIFLNTQKHETELLVFCGGVILATFFNILAYKFSRCYFYLVGAFGFSIFILAHIGNIVAQIYSLIYRTYYYVDDIPLFLANFGLPLGLFGLTSTLHCYQKTYNEKIKNENTRINLGMNDFTKCVAIFNVAIILPFVMLFFYASKYGFMTPMLLIFLPIIFPVFNLLAIYFKNTKLCIVGFVGWGIFVILSIIYFCLVFYKIFCRFYDYDRLSLEDIFLLGTILVFDILLIFVGIKTTLYLYRKYGNQNELKSKNIISKTSFYLWESTKGFMV